MAIEARSLSIPLHDNGLHLVEALRDFVRSRSTKALYRKSESRAVRCDLRVPLYEDCPVDPDVLARTLRKLWRETMETAASGDRMIIDFLRDGDSRLILRAIDSRETNIPDVRAIGPGGYASR